jgi:hypothetical protein
MGAAGGQQITAGAIAGVASKLEKSSIKIYNERDKYNEWEFIYDFAKDRTGAGRMAGAMGNGDPRLGQQAGGQPVNNGPFTGQPGGPGGQAGIGGQTGFGGQPGFGGVSTPQPSTGSSGGGFGFGSGTGGGFGQQPTPQPGPIPPPPPPPPGQTANPPQ